ncbi:HD domain-containing protein [Corallococcus exiguus]|uniref:HD-CE domain-containing protein n=1 Tax=Corallococcus exiguus TaxID=83462 RepID=A0A7X4Y8Q8_9BACT|nr:ATP-binding protein [Corallococcus exiguus]NBC40983.1 hypothetical protein [Corallococcus exiguus]TNV63133.1 hypothetical protein FH620_16215 [Corallococcus exiguus]
MPTNYLQIPKQLNSVLGRNPKLQGAIMLSLGEFEPWIADNKLPFFPEYTDHGPTHINEVFITAEALIHDNTWEHITPEDSSALILAILLHDCAMHLSEDGFIALLKNPDWAKPIVSIDSASWPVLWNNFLQEASRFDGRRLKKLFGDTEPIRPPPLNSNDMSRRDRLLIGEFLRRHHPRLAHEIALSGIPGPTKTPLKLQGIERKTADICGLIARSHGMDLRQAVEHLPIDERREVRGIHAPFIMGVLRVADYLQIHAERAPAKLLNVRALQSPISTGEWKKHDSIDNIHSRHDDPEALYIKALPSDGGTYIALKSLFSSIQKELDDVWAVLGELYGRISGLDSFGIMLRRIRSNLDDEKTFAATAEYVPGQAEFRTASADLLKLLVGPLYGDSPEVGIRELMQNSVDACRELSDYLKSRQSTPKPELTQQDADVAITVERDSKFATITISDRGIGMTPEIVKDYFLKAGASFRSSDAWKKQHTDESGHSRVARSGRFGVGVLAAFLLGERIEVSTRHISQARGISFSAGIDDELVELRYIERPVGTTIRIKSNAAETKALTAYDARWDWYCLNSPSVVRTIKNKGARELKQDHQIPDSNDPLDHQWRRISHAQFSDIQWTYWDNNSSPALACNGIQVPIGRDYDDYNDEAHHDDPEPEYQYEQLPRIGFRTPRVSVFDPDGHLPLNLQRTSLTTRKFPFHDELYDDVCKDFIAYLLVNHPTIPPNSHKWNRYNSTTNIGPTTEWTETWLSESGWGISESSILTQMKHNTILAPSRPGRIWEDCLKTPNHMVLPYQSLSASSFYSWIRSMLSPHYSSCGPLGSLAAQGRRLLLSKPEYDRIKKHSLIAKGLWANYAEEWSNKNWIILSSGTFKSDDSSLRQMADRAPAAEFEAVSEWHLTETQPQIKDSRVGRIWRETIGSAMVPFDMAERERRLDSAYVKLKKYIEAHKLLQKDETDSDA